MSPTPKSPAPVEEPPSDTVGIELGNDRNLGFTVPEGGPYDPQATPPSYSASPQPFQASGLAGSAPTAIIRKPGAEKRMGIINIVLRSVALLFSFLSFVIMASNNHTLNTTDGTLIVNLLWRFNDFREYSYCFSIALIASVYLALQLAKAIYEIITRKTYNFLYYMDFICDQILAYLLASSASAAAVRTYVLNNEYNNGVADIYTEMAAASVSMAFLSCLFVAASSVLSGYNLWKRTSLSL